MSIEAIKRKVIAIHLNCYASNSKGDNAEKAWSLELEINKIWSGSFYYRYMVSSRENDCFRKRVVNLLINFMLHCLDY